MQNEWKLLHDQFGHLPFDKMDRLVELNKHPQKFKYLKGQKVFCPSCVLGKWENEHGELKVRIERKRLESQMKTILAQEFR